MSSKTDVLERLERYAPNVKLGNAQVYSHDLFHDAADEIRRLRAIEERLPKTADGVAVLPGDRVWISTTDGPKWRIPNWETRSVSIAVLCDGTGFRYMTIDECYSTREAAEAAPRSEVRSVHVAL